MQSPRRPTTPRPLAAALLLLAVLAAAQPAAAQETAAERPLTERAAMSRSRGERTAPVLVYEIADFQCPYCARFSREVFPQIDSAYVRSGKVHWVFVNLPLPAHPNAWSAAEAALCAGAVANRFWEMHDRLFADQQAWTDSPNPAEQFRAYAEELGIPDGPFRSCTAGDRVAPLLLEDMIFATSTRLTGTPAFVIDRERLVVGMKSYEEWVKILDEALAAKPARQP